MGDWWGVALAVLLLALNAFFVGAEFALISARRTQIEPRVAEGSRAARTTLKAIENVSLVMAGAQFGITACSLGLGAIGEPAIAHLLEPIFDAVGVPEGMVYPISFVIALGLVVYLHVVLGEMVPKNLALAGPERAALVLGPPMMAIVYVMKPIVVTLNAVANMILRMVRIEPKDEVSSTFTRDEVAAMVDESRQEGALHDGEYDRLAGALGFTERDVRTVLLPRETVVTVARGASVDDVEELCADTGFSRFPVTGAASPTGGDTELVGYLHIKDVLDAERDGDRGPIEDKWLRPLATVRPGDKLHEALASLRRRGAHLGRVVADDGTLLGLVTLEDLLEELIGEVRDAAHAAADGDGDGDGDDATLAPSAAPLRD
ncbi:hemolysin family protein [Nocardioidaceae bacterium]|nr:hemolysin family protein [Nocardioidaceae bacterium]